MTTAVADGLDETLQPYRFNGKESQSFAGLPYLDYGARFYHPLSTRWTTMDPLAEKYYFLSPYAYCSGNPVNFVDEDGRDAVVSVDREAKVITISVNIYIYGKEASDELASKYKESIMDTWGSFQDFTMDGESYSISWDVDVTNLGDENVNMDFSDAKNNYFEINSDIETSSVQGSNKGTLRPIVRGNNDMIHEFGHLLGLSDKYGTNENDKETYRKALDGYGGNVMAEQAGMGVVEPMNIESALYPVTHSKYKRNVYHLNKSNKELNRKK